MLFGRRFRWKKGTKTVTDSDLIWIRTQIRMLLRLGPMQLRHHELRAFHFEL